MALGAWMTLLFVGLMMLAIFSLGYVTEFIVFFWRRKKKKK